MKKPRALTLFSSGLDSILTAKILMEQKIKVTALTFKSYFFNERQAKKAARELKIPLKVIDFSKEHLKMVKNPKYGYGKNMNPCIDCHILMLKKAKEIMIKQKFDFIATGEVLGERPMSQNKKVLELIEKESSLTDCLLRPLSAKLLKKTIPEKLGQVDRGKLLAISGRSRKKQLELAKKFKLRDFPTPAGGCLLTDPEFSKRLKKLFEIFPQCQENDIELLKLGRHFWPLDRLGVKIVVGRNEEENKKIKELVYPPKFCGTKLRRARKGDILIEMENYTGPLTLVRNYGKPPLPKLWCGGKKFLEIAKKLTQYYSTKARDKKDIKFKILNLK